jgi:hypothetical protein
MGLFPILAHGTVQRNSLKHNSLIELIQLVKMKCSSTQARFKALYEDNVFVVLNVSLEKFPKLR